MILVLLALLRSLQSLLDGQIALILGCLWLAFSYSLFDWYILSVVTILKLLLAGIAHLIVNAASVVLRLSIILATIDLLVHLVLLVSALVVSAPLVVVHLVNY